MASFPSACEVACLRLATKDIYPALSRIFNTASDISRSCLQLELIWTPHPKQGLW